jgi:four helix bundle protein
MVEPLRLPVYLRDQLSRASSSISLNLAEGSTRTSAKERSRYYRIAYGSLRETKTILLLAKIRNPELDDLVDHVGGAIYSLLKSVEKPNPKGARK